METYQVFLILSIACLLVFIVTYLANKRGGVMKAIGEVICYLVTLLIGLVIISALVWVLITIINAIHGVPS